MTPDPTLTDEELAEMEERHQKQKYQYLIDGAVRCLCTCGHSWPCPEAKLIAALRASREDADRWFAKAASEAREVEELRKEWDDANGLVTKLEDEVEELKKNQVTHEYDEDTGYCLCTCCDHGI